MTYEFDRGYFEGAGYGYYGFYRDFPVHYHTVEIILKRQPTSVIDIGGARGYLIKKLNDRGIKGDCLDISAHCYHTRATDNFILFDLRNTPYPIPDKAYDLAISISVLEHLPEDKIGAIIKEMARISRRGLHGISFETGPNDIDKTHITMKPKAWWQKKFSENAPDYSVEILDKEETEIGTVMIPTSDGLTKLNIGSYINMFHYGWLNIDRIDLQGFARMNGFLFEQRDVAGLMPWGSGTVDMILASQFLEHLDRKDGLNFLKEGYRVLKTGGTIRLSVPDLSYLTRLYQENSLAQFRHLNPNIENATDEASRLFEMIFKGHRTAYDKDSLYHILKTAGFEKIFVSSFNQSRSAVIRNQTIDSYPTISLYMEAEK